MSINLPNFPYLTSGEYNGIVAVLTSDNSYRLNFCHPLADNYRYNDLLSSIGGEYCQIDYSAKKGEFNSEGLVAYLQYYWNHFIGEFLTELNQQGGAIAAGIVSGIIVMILYIVLLKYLSKILIWCTIGLLFGLLIWGQVAFYLKAADIKEQMSFILEAIGYTDEELNGVYTFYLTMAIIFSVVCGILLILLIIFYNAIRIAAGVISSAMSAIR